ncbi:SpoIIIAH-like family protein [Ferdinandcohnia quinoae]|uniref:SpoIIIAH-like family protein n=1 Tax=Fredinandcohnia quinoae TaxID=2918902 RepID=A0AAW5E2M9_9BACI|nr:SpoIIIAH-like family protein [Fredinandcohnia sp. SECRCQ15]MCH1626623.1 SpoIIIAH-like family protein [Fredinandcohnia sp. SECRCQ15]
MLLKKQTVWLLTMLSLVVVLSVYYITTPDEKNNPNVASEQAKENAKQKENVETSTDDKETSDGQNVTVQESEDGSVISQISSDDDLFTALRMEIDEQRSQLKESLETMVGNNELSSDAKMKAYDDLQKLKEIEGKENVIEMLIKGKNYEDALVRVDGDKVKITVKSKDKSAAAANEIIRLVNSELEDLQDVMVSFDITSK